MIKPDDLKVYDTPGGPAIPLTQFLEALNDVAEDFDTNLGSCGKCGFSLVVEGKITCTRGLLNIKEEDYCSKFEEEKDED